MQSAPRVSVKVEPSKLIAGVFFAVWLFDILVLGAVLIHNDAGLLSKIALVSVYSGLAIALYLTYVSLFQGRLDWDGSASWSGYSPKQALVFKGVVAVMLDMQWLMVLRSQNGLWLVVQKRHYSAHDWLALRRAVFSG